MFPKIVPVCQYTSRIFISCTTGISGEECANFYSITNVRACASGSPAAQSSFKERALKRARELSQDDPFA